MMHTKEDRRVRRTRKLLGDALVALILEKRYDSITVQDIVDRADVGRSTFYAHYYDKEDLLLSEFKWLLDELGRHIEYRDEGERQILPSLELFRHIQQHHHLYEALVWGRGVDLLFKTGHDHLSSSIEEQIGQIVRDRPEPAVPLSVVSNYVAGALLTLLKWWLDNKMPHSPERMDEIFQQLVMPGVRAAITTASGEPIHSRM